VVGSLIVGGGVASGGGSSALRVDAQVVRASAGNDPPAVRLVVFMAPGAICKGRLKFRGITTKLRALELGTRGAGSWQWIVASGLPSGKWSIRVRCRTVYGLQVPPVKQRLRVPRSPGGPKPPASLLAPHSLYLFSDEDNGV
jgi:hypothetical protein